MSSANISLLAATVALSALASPSHAAPDRGAIIFIAAAQERAGNGQRTSGAREVQGNRAGSATANRQSATANRQVRGSATNSVNHSHEANANRNVTVNRDVDVNVHRDYYDGWDDHWHPVAAAAAVTATAMAVGAIVNSIPPSCSSVVVSGVSYSQCGSTWYRPQYTGTTVQYVVVTAPR
jgi:hypothetical protein